MPNRRRRQAIESANLMVLEQDVPHSTRLTLAVRRRRGPVPTRSASAGVGTQNHYRRAADSFAEDANGIVQVFNGIDKPRRFDPALGSYETSGVIPPASQISLATSGVGPIIGDLYAYCRFIDRSGNISSLSPVSDLIQALTSRGNVSAASNESPIVVSGTGLSGVLTGEIVKITGVQGNPAANGVWTVYKLSSTTAALYTDSSLSTPSEGSGTYTTGGTISAGVQTLVYNNVPISGEAKVVRRQILRNKDGDLTTFYIDIDTTDLTTTTFSSDVDSDSLINPVALEDINGHSLVVKTIPPNYKKCVCFQGGRMFAAGNEPYSEGAVAVVNGSPAVTGIGTLWGVETFSGRYFEVVGGTKKYLINSVSSIGQLVLSENYAGSTDPYALYVIQPAATERRTLYWTEPSEFEAWPLANSLALAENPLSGEITGLMSMRSQLYILSESQIDKLSFVNDPILDGKAYPATQRGCVNNRCWVLIEQTAFMLDYRGVHVFSGNEDQDISEPIRDMFRQNPSNKYAINWQAKRNFHAVYSPGEDLLRWFVCLSGSYYPRHAICYHVGLRRWWLEEYPWGVGSACVGKINGKQQVFLGVAGRRIMALGHSSLDGPDASVATVRGTVTSAGLNWLADSTANFATSGLVGNWVMIVAGKGKGQRRQIVSVSSGRVTVSELWTTSLDTTSVYQLGAIGWNWKSGNLRWADFDYKSTRAMSLQYRTLVNNAEMFLRVYQDSSADAKEWLRPVSIADFNGVGLRKDDPITDLAIDTTKSNGYVCFRMDGFREMWTDGPRFIAYELAGYQNDQRQAIFRVISDGAK